MELCESRFQKKENIFLRMISMTNAIQCHTKETYLIRNEESPHTLKTLIFSHKRIFIGLNFAA